MTLEPNVASHRRPVRPASVLLGILVHPGFFWFTLFVGLNLMQSAFTRWCPMMSFLRRVGVS
jgi:hypothetical protein